MVNEVRKKSTITIYLEIIFKKTPQALESVS